MGGALRDLLPQLMDFMMGQPKKKSPLAAGLNLFSWRKIEETV
jgi:hypothetical protein